MLCGTHTEILPASTYKWQNEDLYVPSMDASIIAHKDMDVKTSYLLTRAIHTNLKAFQSAHPFLKRMDAQFMISVEGVPYHAGAVKYYKEAGLM